MFGGFEVNFLPELKHLHDAGYNILTYDLRNCTMSGEANANTSGLGLLGCRGCRRLDPLRKEPKGPGPNDDGTLQPMHGRQLDHHRNDEVAEGVHANQNAGFA